MNSPEIYLLLGDVLSSRKIDNRSEFQKKLIKTCFHANKIYKNDIYAGIDIIKGSDEIGAVLLNLDPLFDIINSMSQKLYPQYIRFVLVKGVVDVGFSTKNISQMDGPVFHKAADLMYALKKDKSMFKMDTQNFITDTLISNNINLIYLLWKRWSAKKVRIIQEYEKTRDQKTVAHKLGLNQQTVSYHIQSSNYNELKRIGLSLNEVLRNLK